MSPSGVQLFQHRKIETNLRRYTVSQNNRTKNSYFDGNFCHCQNYEEVLNIFFRKDIAYIRVPHENPYVYV